MRGVVRYGRKMSVLHFYALQQGCSYLLDTYVLVYLLIVSLRGESWTAQAQCE